MSLCTLFIGEILGCDVGIGLGVTDNFPIKDWRDACILDWMDDSEMIVLSCELRVFNV